jgi:serine/threonine-protein kinase
LPTAVLKPLPSPTATPTLAAIPSPSPLPTIAPSPESSLTASNAASSVSSGFLQLGAKPYATVFIDGKEAGTLPMKPLELGEGRHVVRLVHPDYQPWQRTVTIRKGETSKLFLDWSLDGIPK